MRRPARADAPALVAGGHGRDVVVDGIPEGQNQLGAAVGQDHAALHGKRAALDRAGVVQAVGESEGRRVQAAKASRQPEALLSDFEAFIMAQTRLLGAPSHTCASFRGLNPLRPSSPALAGDVCPVGEKPKATGYSAGPGLNHENSRMVPETGRMGPAGGGRRGAAGQAALPGRGKTPPSAPKQQMGRVPKSGARPVRGKTTSGTLRQLSREGGEEWLLTLEGKIARQAGCTYPVVESRIPALAAPSPHLSQPA